MQNNAGGGSGMTGNSKNKPTRPALNKMKYETADEAGDYDSGISASQAGKARGSKVKKAIRTAESQMSGVPSNTRRAKP